MSKKSQTDGEPSGDPRSTTGQPAQHDAKRAKSYYRVDVPNELAIADELPKKTASDPYNLTNKTSQPTADGTRRRSLDDMRRLSDAIRAAPSWTRPQTTASSALYRRLEELRADLERTLSEIRGIQAGVPSSADRHLVEVIGQLRDVAYHLEDAIKRMSLLQE